MINIILNGALGRMGKEVEKLIGNSDEFSLAARIDKLSEDNSCFKDINDFDGSADIIIDFSFHGCTPALLDYAEKRELPIVIATTGHTQEELERIKSAGEKIPVFHSANMSLGVALLVDLAKKAAEVMPDADIEIVETHHNRKLDAPSGTALIIANALKKVRKNANILTGRSGSGKREKDEIGISSVRMGNIVGIHEVLVSTDNQTITLKHEAHSRALFAEGALSAASFLIGKKAGVYDMNSIVSQ